ncbi:hypothetical protein BV20DRAFT_702124 [Pilatotrama ljubarskyi]|nr:hypothetical protein BV20DRAFT_702124 [Pilatotrama ljubarskyi]
MITTGNLPCLRIANTRSPRWLQHAASFIVQQEIGQSQSAGVNLPHHMNVLQMPLFLLHPIVCDLASWRSTWTGPPRREGKRDFSFQRAQGRVGDEFPYTRDPMRAALKQRSERRAATFVKCETATRMRRASALDIFSGAKHGCRESKGTTYPIKFD